ncbi:MAG: hypothetical protein AAGG38_00255 [Planctomycetota bacterium]
MSERWLLRVTASHDESSAGPRWSASLWDTATPQWREHMLPPTADEAGLSPWAAAVRAAVADGAGVVVGPTHELCLAATVETAGLPKRGRRDLLRYRMEDRLPVPAEALAMDFVCTSAESATLGVAIEYGVLDDLFVALRDAGVTVLAVTPIALLIAQALQKLWGDTPPDVLCTPAENADGCAGVDWLTLDTDGLPIGWITTEAVPAARPGNPPAGVSGTETLPARGAMLLERLGQERDRPLRLLILGEATRLNAPGAHRVDRPPENPRDMVSQAMQRIGRSKGFGGPGGAGGTESAILDLARGGWGPRGASGGVKDAPAWLRPWGYGLAAVLLLVTVGLLLRAGRYDAAAAEAHARQEAAYLAVAGQAGPVPTSVVRRLEAIRDEKQQAAASAAGRDAQGIGGTTGAGESVSAYDRLRLTMRSLPDDPPFTLDRLRFGPDHVFLEGQVLNYQDADELAVHLTRGSPDLSYTAVRSGRSDRQQVWVEWEGRPRAETGGPVGGGGR